MPSFASKLVIEHAVLLDILILPRKMSSVSILCPNKFSYYDRVYFGAYVLLYGPAFCIRFGFFEVILFCDIRGRMDQKYLEIVNY